MYYHVQNNLVYTQFFNTAVKSTLIQMLKTCYVFLCIKIMHQKFQFQYLSKDNYLLRYSPMNVQFQRFLISNLFNFFFLIFQFYLIFKFSWKSISFLKKWYNIDILQLPNLYATKYFLKKLIHLPKVTGKIFFKHVGRHNSSCNLSQCITFHFHGFAKSF